MTHHVNDLAVVGDLYPRCGALWYGTYDVVLYGKVWCCVVRWSGMVGADPSALLPTPIQSQASSIPLPKLRQFCHHKNGIFAQRHLAHNSIL